MSVVINPYRFSAAAGGGPLITIDDRTVSKTAVDVSATALYKIDNDGLVHDHNGGIVSWISDGSAIALYSVRATFQFGDAGQPTGTLGSWLACSSDNQWSVTAAVGEAKTATILVEIRLTSSGVVQDYAVITINAEATASPPPAGGDPPPGGGGGGGILN